MENFNFIGGTQRDLSRKPFMMMDYSTVRAKTNSPFGPHASDRLPQVFRRF